MSVFIQNKARLSMPGCLCLNTVMYQQAARLSTCGGTQENTDTYSYAQ